MAVRAKNPRIRETLLREETYRKGALMIRKGKLPTLYHTNGFKVVSCEIQKAGAVEREGAAPGTRMRLEYQVLKVYLEERPVTPVQAAQPMQAAQPLYVEEHEDGTD